MGTKLRVYVGRCATMSVCWDVCLRNALQREPLVTLLIITGSIPELNHLTT